VLVFETAVRRCLAVHAFENVRARGATSLGKTFPVRSRVWLIANRPEVNFRIATKKANRVGEWDLPVQHGNGTLALA
jgi:hypothetical protein